MWLKYLTIPLSTPISVRVGRELNPPGGKPDPRVKSPMLFLAELPTRLSPQQTAVLLRSSRRPLDPSEPFRDAAKKPPNRDKRDSERRAPMVSGVDHR